MQAMLLERINTQRTAKTWREKTMKDLVAVVDKMKSHRISNYVIAGLDSYLLGEERGMVRLFENSRDHQDSITPHSHRFNFTCLVIAGRVTNRIWEECNEEEGDFFESSRLDYSGEVGSHIKTPEGRGWWKCEDHYYGTGETYSMDADQVHSIKFSRGAKVIFFQEEDMLKSSLIIEPVVNGEVVQTYKKLDYMFKD